MKLEMITTGEEVLSGQTTDTNATWVAQQLAEMGVVMNRRTTVGDRMGDLVDAFRERSQKADVIIVNGGLGPTTDDLSSEAAARALGVSTQLSEYWVAEMKAKFETMKRPMPPGNEKQAMLPEGAELIDNAVGTACGFSVKLNRATLFFTPGVPSEMKHMMREEILPRVRELLGLSQKSYLKRLHAFGIAEAHLGHRLEALELPHGVTLGYRAHLPTIEIKIMTLAEDEKLANQDLTRAAEMVRAEVGDMIFYEDDESMASAIQSMMIERHFSLALAESCTGGMIASELVGVSGSSAYLDRGFVTYSNGAKEETIGVSRRLIQEHGAVSMEVAQAMAEGARKVAHTSHGLSVTGVAGPGGGSEVKPVGTVAFSLATPDRTFTQMVRIPAWSRNRIRLVSMALALDMLRRHLSGLPVFGKYDYAGTVSTHKS